MTNLYLETDGGILDVLFSIKGVGREKDLLAVKELRAIAAKRAQRS